MQRRPKSQASQKLAAQKPAASAPLLQLSSGDQIHHKTFGDGLVISVTPMGGDALLEVAFDTVGTKKLMLKTAGVQITKLGKRDGPRGPSLFLCRPYEAVERSVPQPVSFFLNPTALQGL